MYATKLKLATRLVPSVGSPELIRPDVRAAVEAALLELELLNLSKLPRVYKYARVWLDDSTMSGPVILPAHF